jgi:peroxiredoxin
MLYALNCCDRKRSDRLEFQYMRMTRIYLCVLIIALISIQRAPGAEIGSKAANFQLLDAAGTTRSLQSYAGKIVVLFFWSFKCPISLVYHDRMEALQNKYGNKGVVLLGMDSASNETPAEILANTDNLKITIPILVDLEGSLAEKLGATHTPSVFVLDGNMILRYKGAFDNNRKAGEKGRAAYAEDAIDALLAGKPVLVPETRPFGCSIRLQDMRE